MTDALPWGSHLDGKCVKMALLVVQSTNQAGPEKALGFGACLGNAEVALGSIAVVDIGEGARGDINHCHAAASLHRVVEDRQQPAR